jgi:dihydrofolate reductase
MSTHVYIATSLDGFIADRSGGLDWLTSVPNPTGGDFGFAEFMAGIDALVMGRVTFETVAGFGAWPYDKPVFVVSNSLAAIPATLQGKAELIHGEPSALLRTLRARGHERLYIDGGRTIQGFLAADLVDELIITRVPVLLGGGFPLFGPLAGPLDFEHVSSELLGTSGLVKSRYRRARR